MPNIERRSNVWYATLHVPKDAQDGVGKAKFFQTLKTADKRTAEQRAAVLVAGWKEQIRQARGNSDPFIAKALEWRQDIAQQHGPEAADAVASLLLDHAAEVIEPAHGPEKARAFVALATGQHKPLALVIPEWRASLDLEAKTIDQMVKDVGRMVEKFPTLQGIDLNSVDHWLGELMEKGKVSPSSIKRIVSFCRNFWRYLQGAKLAPKGTCPFVVPDFAKPSKRKKGKQGDGWIPFPPADVVLLHRQATTKGDHQLADLILLGAYSGARIEELCALKVAEVRKDSFVITDAKTEAGVREVPVHSKLTPVVERLKKVSDDGYLFSGLTFNKYDDRSNAIGKRFGRMKKAMGYGEKYVFHSIRKTVVTLLENAGVSENLAADIVGHEKPRITYGLYSGGSSLAVMREAVERIGYPEGM